MRTFEWRCLTVRQISGHGYTKEDEAKVVKQRFHFENGFNGISACFMFVNQPDGWPGDHSNPVFYSALRLDPKLWIPQGLSYKFEYILKSRYKRVDGTFRNCYMAVRTLEDLVTNLDLVKYCFYLERPF